MKKHIGLSIILASTLSFGASNSDLKALKAEIEALKKEVAEMKAAKTETTSEEGDSAIQKLTKKVNEIKAHDAGDNIKWGVDLRTAMDSLNYTMADGTKKSKDSLLTTRLYLNMEFAPDDNNIFRGVLAYNKAFGADFGGNGTGAMPRGWGMDTFDWITNESLSGNGLKVKEAYWLYMGDSMGNANVPWTVSVGRRPSTDGMLVNFREGDDTYKSPLAHMINVEFDGASASANLENVVGIPGAAVKLCLGQGSTNATPMFSGATNYTDDQNSINDIRLAGLIITPYDNGQITSKIQIYRAFDLPGYSMADMMTMMGGGAAPTTMYQVGDMDGLAWSTLVNGLSDDGILADTKVFASLAMSKTHPNGTNGGMLGSLDSEIGTSYWVGAQVPLVGGKFGLEYNHGSKYWRPFTYGEDTMAGSKLAVRGDAWEAYYNYPVTKALSLEARYTMIDYDYTGSNNFFGADGMPMTIAQANGAGIGGMAIDKSSDLRISARYKF
ncbi:MAG: DUF3373 family protein [Sulfurovaceae bacterium]|nr:DUF3373 family protein [Sulfurovaceae bacterium]MDD5548707.1 DUF3373 family protein [Sulfurovaceae bacterium]